MSLTNPNKIVTEERLSEFYGQILPYMGGMPEILANKFSRSDIYSTTEKMIGQAPDGKPLYQISMQASVSDKTTIPIANISTINILNWSGVFVQSSSNNTFKLNTTTDAWVYVERSFNGFYFQSASNWTGEVYITLQYTKTTDSAISIGSDTDYSTTEKIVGTWTDGKPIWQRSIMLPSAYSLTNSWRAITGWSDVISAIDIDKMICHTLSVSLPTRVEFRYDTYQFESTSGTVNLTTTDAITILYTKTS